MHVFPCAAGEKFPAVKGWESLATTEAGPLLEWWGSNPDYNIGCATGPSGLLVVDVDAHKDGLKTLAKLEEEHGKLPQTRCHKTPRGGRHLCFRGSAPLSVEKLGAGIDVRSLGGLIVLPGSYVPAGGYESTGGDFIADAPEWILSACGQARPAASRIADELDTPMILAGAAEWLAKRAPAIEGSGGDTWTFETCAMLKDFGVSEEAMLGLLEPWNERCIPPWEPEALATKVANAYAHGANEPGSKIERSSADVFASAPEYVPAQKSIARGDPYKPLSEAEQDALPDPSWLIKGWLQHDSIAMLYGPAEGYKTFLALDVGLSLAAGLPAFGLPAGRPHSVLYISGEGSTPLGKLRRQTWRRERGVSSVLPYHLVTNMPRAAEPADMERLCARIDQEGLKPDLIVFDTFARLMTGFNESDARDASLAIEAVERVRRHFKNSVVLVLHHTGKDTGRGERGSSAFRGGFTTMIEAEPSEDRKTVRLVCTKQKDDDRPAPLTFRKRVTGKSLVFDLLAKDEAQALADNDEKLSPAPAKNALDVGAALAKMGALGQANMVSTSHLAATICAMHGWEGAEDKITAQLTRRAKKDLQAYCGGLAGSTDFWCLQSGRLDVL